LMCVICMAVPKQCGLKVCVCSVCVCVCVVCVCVCSVCVCF